MFSLVEFVSKKLFLSDDSKLNKNQNDKLEEDNLENLQAQINDIRQTIVRHEEPQLNFNENDKGCFYKTGLVTLVKTDYVLIENKYICEMKYVVPTDLKKGDKVYYMAYKAEKDEEYKVRKIEYKVEVWWENEEKSPRNCKSTEINNEQDISLSDQVLEKRGICERIINGKVSRRKGREVFLEDDTCINLDIVGSDFVPVIGDWVKLKCLVEVNQDIANLKGEILEIQEIFPLRHNKKIGKITDYNEVTESGTIDKTIAFIKDVCCAGYIPYKGDQIVTQYIESDQGIQQNWRALTVAPLDLNSINRFETSAIKNKPQILEDELNEMVKDKEDIEITNGIELTLDAKAEVEIEVTIKNNGNLSQLFHKVSFLSKKSNSQLTLLPTTPSQLLLEPSHTIICKFKCKGRFVGVSEELVIFKFKHFKIGRIFRITVNSIKPNLLNKNNEGVIFNSYQNNIQKSIIPEDYEEGLYIRGVKPFKPAKFIVNRPITYKIPQTLWTIINKITLERKTRVEAELEVAEKIPCLQQYLTFENYKKRFDYLLYLEEIAQIVDMQRFDIVSATLHRSGEYLTLNVPGLAEKRPSLIIGDKAIVSFKWDDTKGEKKYEGFIHKIRSSDIYLKFNSSFHEKYHSEDCQISFKGSTTVIQRCHTAINLVVGRLGQDFLFPKKVVQKEPQYKFIEDETDENEMILSKAPELNGFNKNSVEAIEDLISKKKITWFNKSLNIYQKEAIKNILKGLARPLPYVIFGPPGTGKTITVCEAILQIFCTMPESRILIATPSNSSANLLAERLLNSEILKPGDMVRLVAHHYIDSESIPEKLISYCATADIAAEGSRSDVNRMDLRGCKTNLTLSVLCRHRLIVGTCSALGILHNMGCKAGHFTHVIIDEAGQASEPEIMIPLSLAHISETQVVLAGDPKQLGPVNQSRLAGYFGLNDSFLVRLLQQFPYQRDPQGFATGYDPRLVTKLLMNYRSLPDLLELPNKLFYEAELIPQVDPEESEEAELLDCLSDMLPKRLGAPPSVVFHSVDGKNIQDPDSPSWYNLEEATQVYIYLLDLYNHGLTPDDIGVITPYSKQVYRIRSLLAELEVEVPKVGSVEEFQGQERKVIILSTVRTAEDKVNDDLRHALGFVAAKERLNVAITRARTLLIIIGNAKLLQLDVYWRSVLEHCNSRGSYVKQKLCA